ncbi:hypothetical protein FOA52_000786 [Chlamydomonas sp. UWO 241]|nr:hypothetical protein FOA52_000786 [Chlamydomonas sp. UWO 241]
MHTMHTGSGPLILQLPAAKAAAPQTTVTCRNDLHPVVSALTQQYIKVAQEANGMMAMMAPLRIFAVKIFAVKVRERGGNGQETC